MSNSYIIDNTDGSVTFVIEPGSLDGPGGLNRNSDLYLYGQGSIKWGEGVNESLYRLSESFACPEKGVSDTGFVAGEPRPKDETDLGAVGLGITTPVNGQLWYNTTTKTLYTYDAVNDDWRSGSGLYIDTDPASPVTGDFKYDSDYHGVGVPQLTIYTGAAFESVAHEYVELAGDSGARGAAMTGLLTLSGDPVNPLHAATKQYADNTFVDAAGDTMSGTLNMGANAITNVADPTTDDHVADRGYNDTRYVNAGGDAMTGALSMGTNKITNVVDPTSSQEAATKNYVDTAISTLLGNMFPVGSIFVGTNPTGTLPGTWAQVADGTFLMASGGTNPPGTTGGNNNKTLSISEMPAHNHGGGAHQHFMFTNGPGGAFRPICGAPTRSPMNFGTGGSGPDDGYNIAYGNAGQAPTCGLTGSATATISTQGGGASWDKRPQFEAVEMWKRTA